MNHPAAAPDTDDSLGYYRRMQAAIEELLVLKGLVTRDEIDAEVAAMDARSWKQGASVVARAWVDPGFKARLLANGAAACKELGIDVGPMHLVVVENQPALHNVIVCTLCSCYPRMLLGMPPAWYKSAEYRRRVVREPRKVLAEFGLVLPAGTDIRVHDSSADMRYLVLPMRPAGTEALDEAALAARVTPESLVGTGVPA